MTPSETLDEIRYYVLRTNLAPEMRTIEDTEAITFEVEKILTDTCIPWYILIELYYIFKAATSLPDRDYDWPLIISMLEQSERLQKILQADKKWLASTRPCSRRDL